MKIIYGKNLNDAEFKTVGKIASECGIMFDTARLLLYRGIDTVEKAKRFLDPGKHRFNNPFLLSGMKEAVEKIKEAKEKNSRVLVFGDYDADGVCATTVLYFCLKKFGINAEIVVPEREDGYGLNLEILEKFLPSGKIDLLITVDCGISDGEKIAQIIANGTDVIVTDHHEPPEELPNCICINPKIKGQSYPFDGLCGAGVAYKLGSALINEEADEYLDFVALATVADSMNLIEENRDIVVEGLKLIQSEKSQRQAFKYLIGESNRQITAQTLAYVVAPRVNAGGRMGDANTALKIFTETNPNTIFDLAVKLNEYNIARQAECDNIYKEAKAKIKENGLDANKVILVGNEEWQPGFVGIVAAKLVEDYARPVIVFAGHDGHLKGSARSVDNFNIYEAISASKDILIAYGGHSQAAGVAVTKENLQLLSTQLNEYFSKLSSRKEEEKRFYAEWEVVKPLTIRFAKEIDSLEPFGVGNKRPVFTTTVESVESLPLKSGSIHYSFKTDVIEMLDFNGEKNVFPLLLPIKKKVAFEINLSTYKNRESLKGYCRQVIVKYDKGADLLPYIIENELEKISSSDGEYKLISREEAKNLLEKGGVAIASDPSIITDYSEFNKCNPNYFFFEQKQGVNLIISPILIDEIGDNVIYYEKPLTFPAIDKHVYLVQDACYPKYLELLSTRREDFALVFNKLVALNGKAYKGSAHFAIANFNSEEVYQAVFGLEVFIELGIFKIKNGIFYYDSTVKNALTNSIVYSKIDDIKG